MNIYSTSTISNCIKKASKLAYEGSKVFDNVLIFAEDKITLSLELEICNLANGGFMNIDVCTFKRYISTHTEGVNALSKESSAMAVRKLILQNQKEFSCFKNSILKPNLPITLYELISQLKSAKITPLDLKEIVENKNCDLSSSLLFKIKDILLIYTKYEDYLKENSLLDSNDYLLTIIDVIKKDLTLKNSYVLLVGFSTLTKQRQDIFLQLKSACKQIDAVLLSDDDSEFYTRETIDKLLKIIDHSKLIKEPSTLNKDAEILKKYLLNPTVFKEDFKGFDSENVSIFEGYSPKDEIDNVAKDILVELKHGGKRFKDISLTVGDLDGYLPIIKKIFNDYQIPYYVDKNALLSDHPLCDYILAYLQLIKRGFCREDFISFTTSPLFCVDKSLTDDLTEYVLKFSMTRKELCSPFVDKDDNLEKFEGLRQKAYDVYKLFDGCKTADEYVKNVKTMLLKTDAFNNLKLLSDKLSCLSFKKYSNNNETAFEKTDNILNEINSLLTGITMPVIDFTHILLSGMTATTIGSIPLFSDAVYVGSCKDVKIKNADILYAVGLNGEIPFSKSDTAILTDSDLYELDSFKVIVEPKLKIVNLRERENVCLSLISFNEKLKISYSNTTANGKEVVKSELINYISRIFNLKPLRKFSSRLLDGLSDVVKNANKYSTTLSSLKEIAVNKELYLNGDENARLEIASVYKAVETENLSHFKKNIDDILSSNSHSKEYIDENLVKNYNDNTISASVLESYFACPYSNYAKNVLRLKESQTGEMKPFETGKLLHTIVQKYVERLNEVSDLLTSNQLVEKLYEKVLLLDDFKKLVNNPKFSYLKTSLLNESKRVCFEVFTQQQTSLFKPYLIEQSFGENSKYSPITLKSKKGDFKLNGKVDRIDKYEKNIRVIDYKSGDITSSEESFYTGNKLQLYLYMNAFISDDLKPAGAYYFPIHDEFNEKGYPYKMQGKTVKDENILHATDKTIYENNGSKIIGTKITSKTKQPYANSPILTANELENYLKYSLAVSEKGIDEFCSGYIKPSPYKESCRYCKYNAMCGFFIKDDNSNERKEYDVKSSTIINAVANLNKGDKNE